MTKRRLISIARKHSKKCNGKNHHVTIMLKKNRILSVGYNDYEKTDTFALKNGYKYHCIHSELMALKSASKTETDYSKISVYNFRFAKADDSMLLAKPCKHCLKMLVEHGIHNIYYSTNSNDIKILSNHI